MTRNLVISPIGGRSRHRTWISDPTIQQFDVMLIDYAHKPSAEPGDGRYYIQRQGFKYELLSFVAQAHRETLSQYDAIWCPDDDIAADTATVNRLFTLFRQYNLQLAQPAISEGQVSYRALLRQPDTLLRYTPYVEVMCPLFTRVAFYKAASTFDMNRSGWGIDWVWSTMFKQCEMAIIDAAAVHHTGVLGTGEHYQKLAALGILPNQDFHRAVASVGGIDWRIHRKMVKGRMRMPSLRLDGSSDRQTLRTWIGSYWRRTRRVA